MSKKLPLDREQRRVDINLAKTILWKKNVTEAELTFVIQLLNKMPRIGYKAKGILGDLRQRRQDLFG